MKMKTTKSDYFFTLVFLFASIITIIAGIEICPAEERFETFWFTIIFSVFLEAVIFLKPILIEQLDTKKGVFLVSLVSFSFTYSVISFVLLISTNILFKGESPWPIIIILFWTILYLFLTGLFIKSSSVNDEGDRKDVLARSKKNVFANTAKEYLNTIKEKLLIANISDDSINSSITTIEKMIENMSPNKGRKEVDKIEDMILNDLKLFSLEKIYSYLDANKYLSSIKENFKSREKYIKL
jgi:hypothetical protein